LELTGVSVIDVSDMLQSLLQIEKLGVRTPQWVEQAGKGGKRK